jgi:type IV pilus assembly protein PilM
VEMFRNGQVVHFSIGNHYLRFVTATKNRVWLDYGQKCLPEGVIEEGKIQDRETLQMILEEMVDRWKLKGSKLSFLVPNESVIVRKTSVPLESRDDELTGYLYMQLGENIHLPFDNPILEAIPLGQNEEGQKDVLVMVSNETIVTEYANVFEKASLKPIVADFPMLSLYRTYYHLGLARPEEHVLFIQIGLDTMLFSVFNQHKPMFVHHVQLPFTINQFEVVRSRSGSEFFTWNDRYETLIGQTRDMMMEIDRFLTYYRFNLTKNKYSITKIFATGAHPCMETFVTHMNNQLDIDVQSILQPLFQTKKGINIPPVYAECIGLSLK